MTSRGRGQVRSVAEAAALPAVEAALVAAQLASSLRPSSDDDPGSASLDRSCAARAQGANREERALNYHRHLEVVFGPRMDLSQPIVTVPGVGHDASGMLSSRWGREALRAG